VRPLQRLHLQPPQVVLLLGPPAQEAAPLVLVLALEPE
jgi:hypothetical protein